MIQCPRCQVELKNNKGGDSGILVIESCPNCNGSWFEKGKLDRSDGAAGVSVEQDVQFFPAAGKHDILRCPKCASDLQPLSPRGREELVIDRCSSCEGFWLDDKELELIRKVAFRKRLELESRPDGKMKNSGSGVEVAVARGFVEIFFEAIFY